MNLKALMKSVLMTALLLGLMSIASFAQVYVNNTNGDDYNYDGKTSNRAFMTIAKALTVVPSGGIISIAADTYKEPNVIIEKSVTLVSTPDFNGLSTVTITNGITINTTNASDIVNLGRSIDNSLAFKLGTDDPVNALVLKKGNLQISSTNVTIADGGSITRLAGTLDNAPTVTNVNVVYNSPADITSGGELPSNLGTGSLSISLAAGKTLTTSNGLSTKGGIVVNSGNVNFAGSVSLSTSDLNNIPSGNSITVGGNISFTTGRILNQNTGTITINGNASWTIVNSMANPIVANLDNGTVSFNGNVSIIKDATGQIGSNPVVAFNNDGSGIMTLAKGFSVTSASWNSDTYTPVVNATNASTGSLVFNGPVTLNNLLNAAAGTVVLTGGVVSGAITNNNGGTIELAAHLSYSGTALSNNNAASIIKLNAYTLTFAKAGTITNLGKIISVTSAQVGSGTLAFTKNYTVSGGIELPNITVASGVTNFSASATNVYGSITNYGTASIGNIISLTAKKVFGSVTNTGTMTSNIDAIAGNITSSGAFTSGVALTVDGNITSSAAFILQNTLVLKGNYAQNVGGTLNFGANRFEVQGNWIRTSNTPDDVTYLAGAELKFTKGNAQIFTPGASLVLYDIYVDKDDNTVVTLNQSLQIERNFTIQNGKVDLGDFNIRMTGTTGDFVNKGDFYSTTGNGYLIFEGAPGSYNISGNGTFSNMDIRNGSTVIAGSDINFSGKLVLRNGALTIGAHTFTYNSSLIQIPSVTRYVDHGSMTAVGGQIKVADGVVYDLIYMGSANRIVDSEWIPGGINDLTIATGDDTHGFVISGPTDNFTIAGNLKVNLAQTLDLNGHKITFQNDDRIHTIIGKVSNGLVEVKGDNVKINGSKADAAEAEIPTLTVNIAAAKYFKSFDLKKVNGDLTIINGASTVSMNAKTATITGDVNLAAGSLILGMNSVTSVHNGSINVTDGALTYTRATDASLSDDNRTISGGVTLTAGILTLGSNVLVKGATSMTDGSLALNGNKYVQYGSAASPDFIRSGAGLVTGEGSVIFYAKVADIDVTNSDDFSIPNVEFKVENNNIIVLNNALNISNSLTHTNGAIALNNLTLSGNIYNYNVGTYLSGTLTFKGSNTVATLKGNVTIPSVVVDTEGKISLVSTRNTEKRIVTVSKAFTQTAGTIDMGMNDIEIAGTFARTTGSWAQTTGILIFNTNGAVDVADGFAVDNMKITKSVDFTSKALTINKYLTLTSGTLTTDAVGKLAFGNGATIERQSSGTALSKTPTFGNDMNNIYGTFIDGLEIVTGKELAPTVKSLIVRNGGSVKLATKVKINCTLYLASMLKAAYSSDAAITMADGSTLELKANGDAVLDERLTKLGKVNIIYNGATHTTENELGKADNPTTHSAGNVTFISTVTLDAAATFYGEVKFDGGSLDNNGKDLYVQGDVTQTENGGFFAPTSLSNLYFSGNSNSKVTIITQILEIDNLLKITLKKVNGTNTVTLIGGSFDFAKNHQVLYFNNGLLVTGDNYVQLDADAGHGQGFKRTDVTGTNMSHIVGNIKKSLENHYSMQTASDSRVEFPLGSSIAYRPVVLTFNPTNGNIPTVPNATLTVSAVATAPSGTGGLPITDGISAGVPVARYGDFYWTIKSDVGVSTQLFFDLEMTAAGFTSYKNISNIRIIRRNGPNSDTNPTRWILQGGNKYDNYEGIPGVPTVILKDAFGGIITDGAVYTYGLETNLIAQPMANKELTVGENTYKVVLTNPAVFTGNSGTLKFSAQSSNNNVARVTVDCDTLTVTPVAVGSADITVTGKDSLDFATNIFTVKVNPVTNFTVKGKVSYANTAVTALKDVKITLNPGNLCTTTDANGCYAIPNVPNGTYTVLATSAAPWLGIGTITGGDALLAAQYTVDPVKYALSDIQVSAADVNLSNTVNASDALLIQRRVVGLDKSFAKGDWTFSTKNIIVAGADVIVDIKGIAVGDVNASYAPAATLAKTASFINEGSLKVAPGSAIQIPVKVDAQNLAAVTLKFKYSEELGQFTGISSKLNGLLANAENGVVTICWADLSGKALINVDSKEALLTLNFKSTENFKAGKSFSLDMNDAELVSADGKIINSTLKSATVDAFVPTEFALCQNYPNPFNPTTTIQYDLPMNAHVTLTVTNILGQEVVTLVNSVEDAGTHKIQFNANNITSGIYFYTINASNGDHKFSKTYKMMLMK